MDLITASKDGRFRPGAKLKDQFNSVAYLDKCGMLFWFKSGIVVTISKGSLSSDWTFIEEPATDKEIADEARSYVQHMESPLPGSVRMAFERLAAIVKRGK